MGILNKIFKSIFGSKAEGGETSTGAPGAPQPSSQPTVDVDEVFKRLAAAKKEKLNWKTSIVDLLKLVGMESDLQSRKELASELGYTGNTNDSAAMNVWLHKEVVKKIAANGGNVPQELLAA